MNYHVDIVCSNPNCASELDGWNLTFDDKLVQYDARVLPPETIIQKQVS